MQNEIAENAIVKPHERTGQSCWHLVTSEFPPQSGGVSDYSNLLAAGLAEYGDEVHVWCPACPGTQPHNDGVVVHRQCGSFSPADLHRVGDELDRFPGPRRILVQWVPHGYGYRSMNLAFCWWVWKRAKQHGDQVELMVHEPSLPFRWLSPRQDAAAVVHRLMTVLLLRAAERVWMSIPGWEPRLRPYALGRRVQFEWLPIFSNVPVAGDPIRALEIRRRYASDGGQVIVGHFGTFGSPIASLLGPIVSALARDPVQQIILLMGERSELYRRKLIEKEPGLEGVVRATGQLSAEELSYHLSACDLLIQPYPDGVSTRRGSFMAGLAHGKPIVTTTGELTETLWSEGSAVALAPPGDTLEFVKHVRRLRGNAAERLRAGAAARQLYQRRFDISHTISSLRKKEMAKEHECGF
jgi:glycosyltransferase involved in cell wall biosynthesis